MKIQIKLRPNGMFMILPVLCNKELPSRCRLLCATHKSPLI